MRRVSRSFSFLAVAGAIWLACADNAGAPAVERGDPPSAVLSNGLRRGVNILGYDGLWKGEIDAPFRMSDFETIRSAGFDHVRVNFFGFRYMDSKNRLDEAVLLRLDKVLDTAEANDLNVVLDQHDNEMCQSVPEKCKAKLASFWRQIAARYAGKRPRVVYELLNEPGGGMSAAQWNEALAAGLAEIRAREPSRRVVVAALNLDDPRAIEQLRLPDADRNLIVTIHYYHPYSFTFQGASWAQQEFANAHGVAWGTERERARVAEDLAIVADWARPRGLAVYLGEFGVYDEAPPKSRLAWTRHVAKTAESFGWAWCYWQFDHDFALFDSATGAWNRPLLEALTK